VQGEGGGWRHLDDWPPCEGRTRWFLHPEGRLSTDVPTEPSEPDRYRYDPADPTPSLGGTGMLTGGVVDNRPLESRPDVLVYTSEVLDQVLEVTGPVEATLRVGSSVDHTDFFVRLCDVGADGASLNVCDGIQRLNPSTIDRGADGTFEVTVALWPAGHRFGPGHRVRVQVSSGAHPVFARNLGTGDDIATATTLRPADQAVFHQRSWVTLPHS
jgi:uncharacterized protein